MFKHNVLPSIYILLGVKKGACPLNRCLVEQAKLKVRLVFGHGFNNYQLKIKVCN